MGVGAGDKPVEADSSDEGFCVLDGRGRKSGQEFGDFVDAGAAVALILSCGEKSHCLANVLLVNSANRAAGSNTVIAFDYDRDLYRGRRGSRRSDTFVWGEVPLPGKRPLGEFCESRRRF